MNYDLLLNLIPVVLGWGLWNWAELVMEQRSLDNDGNPNTNFSFADFKKKKKFTWIGNLLCCPLMLWIGYKGLSLDLLEPIIGAKLGWNDLYLLGSGAAFEIILFIISWIRKFINKLNSHT